MRIALDTNVLISAYTSRGLSSDVFRYILVDHDLILSEKVLDEFARVLETKFGVPKNFVADFLNELRQHHVEPLSQDDGSFGIVRDQDDRIVLRSAINAAATVLITGGRDLLDVRDEISAIEIQNPREFWEAVRKGK